LKTDHPLIVTAKIHHDDLEPIDRLRQQHFPSNRNFLRAHLTMFYRLPGEHISRICLSLEERGFDREAMHLEVTGVRHLGAGVAFSISSSQLAFLRTELRQIFLPWLGSQDMQPWKPHITIQNKASRKAADSLHASLAANFQPFVIRCTGLDLWSYLAGPWRLENSIMFRAV
jgi:2'-5' RNA ligase